MAITHNIELDVHKRTSRVPPEVVCRQGESGTETIVVSVTKDGEDYSSSCTYARLDILHADGTWARVTGTKSSSTVTVTLPSAALSSHGLCKLAHIVFYNSSNSNVETTEGFLLRILPAVDGSGQEAQDYDDQLSELYKRWLADVEVAEKQEAARVSAENARVSNENTRISNEKTRVSQETARVAAEKNRASAETTRQSQEATRQSQETARVAAEKERASAETTRQSQEATRQSQEAARVKAEQSRASEYTGIVNAANTATSAAQGAAATANAAANTALEIANTVAQGAAGDSDIAALKEQNAALASKIADLEGDYFVMDTTIYAPSSKASMSGTTATVSSTSAISGSTVTLA